MIQGSVPLPLAGTRQVIKALGSLLRSHSWLLAAGLSCSVLAAAGGLVAPWVVGQVVDAVQQGQDAAGLLPLALFLMGAGVLAAALTAAGTALVSRLGQLLLGDLREDALARTLTLPVERVEQAGYGDVLSRLGDDVAVIGRTIGSTLGPLVSALLAVLLTVGGLALLHPVLAVAGLCALPVYWFSLRWYLPRAAQRYAKERSLFGRRAEVVVSALHGASTINAYGAENDFSERIEKSSDEARACSTEILWFYTGWSKWLNFAELTGLGMIVLCGYLLVDQNILTVGAVTAAALLFHRLFNPIGMIISSLDDIQSAAASLARVVGLAHAPLEEPARDDGGEPFLEPGAIVIESLGHLRGNNEVLHGIELSINPGERVALVGSSGAGKSTLAAIIAGMLTASSGRVRLGDASVLEAERSRPPVILLTQDSHVFSGPLSHDLSLARPQAQDTELEEALAIVGALGWVRLLPEGLHTVVGDGGFVLNAEQSAQLALARVWLADPLVLILDEASADSTSRYGGVLDRASEAVLKGRTGVVVAHRLTQASTADRILVMEDGKILEQGTHAALLSDGGRYADLWESWAGSLRGVRE